LASIEGIPEDFWHEIAGRASDQMMDSLPGEEELARQYSFSPGFEGKLAQKLQQASMNKRPMSARKALLIAAIIVVLAFSAAMSVSAVRKAMYKFFVTIYEKFAVISFRPADEEAAALMAPESILNFLEPAYVPEGYRRHSEDKSEFIYTVRFLHEEGFVLLFEQSVLDSTNFDLDIEAALENDLFEINGTTTGISLTGGNAGVVCSVSCYQATVTKCSIKANLQQYKGGAWVTIATWEKSFNDSYGSLTATKAVTKGYDYRTQAISTATSAAGTETYTGYSGVKSY
jgi:hypothetical protein